MVTGGETLKQDSPAEYCVAGKYIMRCNWEGVGVLIRGRPELNPTCGTCIHS